MFRSREFAPPSYFRPHWTLRWLALAVLFGVTAAVAAYAFEVGKRLAGSSKSLWEVQVSNKAALDQLQEQVKRIDAEIKAQKAPNTQGSSMSNVERSISVLQHQVAEMATKQARIEAVLLADPAKALEVPLILRDIEAMKQNQQVAQTALRHDVERLFVLGLGIAGILLTSVVGIFFAPRQFREEKTVGHRNSHDRNSN